VGARDVDRGDGDAFLDGDVHRTARIDLDVLHVARSDVPKLVVVRVDLLDVIAQRVGVEHRADRGIHEREEHIRRNLLVPREDEFGDDRILNHDVGDRHAAWRRVDVGLDVREIAQPQNRLLVCGDQFVVQRGARLHPDDRRDPIGGDVRIAADVDRGNDRLRRGCRGQPACER
jgi:hypothetical protein